jgi:hypothetical protein
VVPLRRIERPLTAITVIAGQLQFCFFIPTEMRALGV